MYFLFEDDDLLGKHNTIWDKVSADIKNSYRDEATDFHDKKFLRQILITLVQQQKRAASGDQQDDVASRE